MLKTKMIECQWCGVEVALHRRTKAYCSDACRKAASRESDSGRRAQDDMLIEALGEMRYIAQVWPVYSWDMGPPILALTIPRQIALAEINLKIELGELKSDQPIAEADLARAMRLRQVANYGEPIEAKHIDAFYRARKDRRFR
jgi:hypothetical protein